MVACGVTVTASSGFAYTPGVGLPYQVVPAVYLGAFGFYTASIVAAALAVVRYTFPSECVASSRHGGGPPVSLPRRTRRADCRARPGPLWRRPFADAGSPRVPHGRPTSSRPSVAETGP